MSIQQLLQKGTFWFLTIFLLIGTETIFAEDVRYLIITRSSFIDAIQPLVEWKNKKGLKTKVVSFENIPDTNIVKDTILHYNPEYVLLVGQPNFIPTFEWQPLPYVIHTDNYYADTNNNTLTDIYVGRFPARDPLECQIMVTKTMLYERTPYMLDTTWFLKGTTIANGRGQNPNTYSDYYLRTCMNAETLMLINAGFSHVDTFFDPPDAGSPYNPDSVIHAVDDGRTYLLYRGEATGWWWSPFWVEPEQTSNYQKFPFVISGSCATIFLSSIPREWMSGEIWLRTGTPANPKGAVAYFGTTYAPPYSPPPGAAPFRGAVAGGLFRALFEEESLTTGSVAKRGKDSLYQEFGLTPDGNFYVEWNLLGDPELNLWTAVPKPLAVTHDDYIPLGSQTFSVTVKDQNTQEPVDHALVCVMMPNNPDFYHYGYTDNSGTIAFEINPSPDSMCVTVTARNYHPYEGACRAVQFLSDSPGATGFNQTQHLARKPNSIQLQMVYHSNERICYSQSTNNGQKWTLPESVDFGRHPCIALGSNGISPWVFYFNRGSFQLSVRRPNGSWKTRVVFQGDENPMNEWSIGPAMKLAICPSIPPREDLAYGVFMYNDRIYFYAFDTTQNYCDTVLDEYSSCLAPSISITPKDLFHVVWQRTEGERSQIYYITTIEGITSDMIRGGSKPKWSDKVRVSTEQPWPTEPASNPSVEAHGEYVYAAWRGPNENGDSTKGDIWRRARQLDEPPWRWRDPQNKSETPDNESNYPVMSTDFVTVWQEQIDANDWDIWARFESEPTSQRLFKTPRASTFPNIEGY